MARRLTARYCPAMRIWLFALLVACGGSTKSSPPPISNQPSQPVTVQTPPPPAPAMPVCADKGDMKCLIGQMEFFSNQMCACSDKACANSVNDSMVKWGTELANNASMVRSQKPDPADAKRSSDVMTKYTECMVKVMMADAGSTDPNPQPIPDPCGGDPNPCGD
jgi:hypothetical protein